MDPEENLKLFTKLYTDDIFNIHKTMEEAFMKKKSRKPKEEPVVSSFDLFKAFYDTYTEKLIQHSAKYVASYKEIMAHITDGSRTLLEIRQYLGNFSTAYLNDTNTFSKMGDSFPAAENIFESLVKKYPKIEFVTDDTVDGGVGDLPRISFRIPISMKYVSLENNDAWEITPEIQPISIVFNTLGLAKYISTNLNHPYMPKSQNLISAPIITQKRTVNDTYMLDVIDDTISLFRKFDAKQLCQPVELFIGKKCTVCSARDKDVNATCRESGAVMHKSCGKVYNGALYNPTFIKECSSCKKENLFWVIKSGNVICESCNNE